jgi:hypothetical protein
MLPVVGSVAVTFGALLQQRKPLLALTWVYELRYTSQVEARYPSGKGEVCKTFMRGFDSHPRLQQIPNVYASISMLVSACHLHVT